MDDLINIFAAGLRAYRHRPVGRRASAAAITTEQARFIQAHRELYHLAQAIGTRFAPSAQRALDRLRREVMLHIAGRQASATLAGVTIQPARVSISSMQWSDYIMTPEFQQDPSLTGILLPIRLVNELRKAHREQVMAILHVAGF